MGMHPKGISCGAPAVFANPYASGYQHISFLKITQLKFKNKTINDLIRRKKCF